MRPKCFIIEHQYVYYYLSNPADGIKYKLVSLVISMIAGEPEYKRIIEVTSPLHVPAIKANINSENCERGKRKIEQGYAYGI